ncbi:hypothetical protein LARI1_G009638, partial [Lachnellula arida]
KRKEQIELSLRIDRVGNEMAPCTRYEKSDRRCVALPEDGKNSDRCAECARNGKSCDVRARNRMPSLSDWASIDRQRQRIRDERDEAMAKILRLSRQEKVLEEREKKMIRAGLNSLDELDALEESERKEKEEEESKEKEQAEQEARQATFFDGAGSSEGPLGSDFFLDPADPALAAALSAYDPNDPYWQGAGPGTPQTSQGS